MPLWSLAATGSLVRETITTSSKGQGQRQPSGSCSDRLVKGVSLQQCQLSRERSRLQSDKIIMPSLLKVSKVIKKR